MLRHRSKGTYKATGLVRAVLKLENDVFYKTLNNWSHSLCLNFPSTSRACGCHPAGERAESSVCQTHSLLSRCRDFWEAISSTWNLSFQSLMVTVLLILQGSVQILPICSNLKLLKCNMLKPP